MKIILFPIVTNDEDDTPPIVDGPFLTYRNKIYDLTNLSNGAEIEIGYPFIEPAVNINNEIICKLEYKHSSKTSLSSQPKSWADYTFELDYGQCPCPIKRKPAQEAPLESTDE